MEKWLVGVDVGGTTTKIAFVSPQGDIITKCEISTDTSNAGGNIVSNIAASIERKLTEIGKDKAILKGIGIGVPAFLNMEKGFVYRAVNIGWVNFDLKSELEASTKLPVIIDNDANVAAIGEMWKGAGTGSKDLVCMTLGTGVGGGVIINGEIIHGTNGMAGEIGHLKVVLNNGDLCNCGKTGCLETVASATGMVNQALKGINEHPTSILFENYAELGYITSKLIVDAAMKDDDYARSIIEHTCYFLGLAIANIGSTINPSKVVIGGGVSKAGDILLEPIQTYFKQFALPRVAEGMDISVATLGNDAGVIGGAWLVKNKL